MSSGGRRRGRPGHRSPQLLPSQVTWVSGGFYRRLQLPLVTLSNVGTLSGLQYLLPSLQPLDPDVVMAAGFSQPEGASLTHVSNLTHTHPFITL